MAELYDEEKEMKTVEILTKAGLQKVPEKELSHYKGRGATMPDGKEIKLPESKKKEEPKEAPKTEKKETKKEKPKTPKE